MINYNLLDFQHFPSIIGNNIIIDENTLFFKSYEKKYNSLQKNRPSFFGSIDNATKYLTKDKNLGIFSTKKEIKLLDIRYISQIINDLILLRKNNDFDSIIKGYMTLTLSYGLVSLYKQMTLYKMRYANDLNNDKSYEKIINYLNNYEKNNNKELFQNPIELQGIRIGETNNDVESTFILKEIFENFFDGIICPTIFSPYFDDNYIPNEILLFKPIDNLIELDKIPDNINSLTMNDLLIKNNINLFTVPYFMKNDETTYFQYGGILQNKFNKIDFIYEKNNLINKISHKKIKELKKQGKEFKKNIINNKFSINKKEDIIFNKNILINFVKLKK